MRAPTPGARYDSTSMYTGLMGTSAPSSSWRAESASSMAGYGTGFASAKYYTPPELRKGTGYEPTFGSYSTYPTATDYTGRYTSLGGYQHTTPTIRSSTEYDLRASLDSVSSSLDASIANPGKGSRQTPPPSNRPSRIPRYTRSRSPVRDIGMDGGYNDEHKQKGVEHQRSFDSAPPSTREEWEGYDSETPTGVEYSTRTSRDLSPSSRRSESHWNSKQHGGYGTSYGNGEPHRRNRDKRPASVLRSPSPGGYNRRGVSRGRSPSVTWRDQNRSRYSPQDEEYEEEEYRGRGRSQTRSFSRSSSWEPRYASRKTSASPVPSSRSPSRSHETSRRGPSSSRSRSRRPHSAAAPYSELSDIPEHPTHSRRPSFEKLELGELGPESLWSSIEILRAKYLYGTESPKDEDEEVASLCERAERVLSRCSSADFGRGRPYMSSRASSRARSGDGKADYDRSWRGMAEEGVQTVTYGNQVDADEVLVKLRKRYGLSDYEMRDYFFVSEQSQRRVHNVDALIKSSVGVASEMARPSFFSQEKPADVRTQASESSERFKASTKSSGSKLTVDDFTFFSANKERASSSSHSSSGKDRVESHVRASQSGRTESQARLSQSLRSQLLEPQIKVSDTPSASTIRAKFEPQINATPRNSRTDRTISDSSPSTTTVQHHPTSVLSAHLPRSAPELFIVAMQTREDDVLTQLFSNPRKTWKRQKADSVTKAWVIPVQMKEGLVGEGAAECAEPMGRGEVPRLRAISEIIEDGTPDAPVVDDMATATDAESHNEVCAQFENEKLWVANTDITELHEEEAKAVNKVATLNNVDPDHYETKDVIELNNILSFVEVAKLNAEDDFGNKVESSKDHTHERIDNVELEDLNDLIESYTTLPTPKNSTTDVTVQTEATYSQPSPTPQMFVSETQTESSQQLTAYTQTAAENICVGSTQTAPPENCFAQTQTTVSESCEAEIQTTSTDNRVAETQTAFREMCTTKTQTYTTTSTFSYTQTDPPHVKDISTNCDIPRSNFFSVGLQTEEQTFGLQRRLSEALIAGVDIKPSAPRILSVNAAASVHIIGEPTENINTPKTTESENLDIADQDTNMKEKPASWWISLKDKKKRKIVRPSQLSNSTDSIQ
ncbi:hypothetical protein HDV05_008395 [Chytridiales sp. JEL 0842]|nr:hypothetical protein HDV05_008395 [Chytridiales sp. JEL 0842]